MDKDKIRNKNKNFIFNIRIDGFYKLMIKIDSCLIRLYDDENMMFFPELEYPNKLLDTEDIYFMINDTKYIKLVIVDPIGFVSAKIKKVSEDEFKKSINIWNLRRKNDLQILIVISIFSVNCIVHASKS